MSSLVRTTLPVWVNLNPIAFNSKSSTYERRATPNSSCRRGLADAARHRCGRSNVPTPRLVVAPTLVRLTVDVYDCLAAAPSVGQASKRLCLFFCCCLLLFLLVVWAFSERRPRRRSRLFPSLPLLAGSHVCESEVCRGACRGQAAGRCHRQGAKADPVLWPSPDPQAEHPDEAGPRSVPQPSSRGF